MSGRTGLNIVQAPLIHDGPAGTSIAATVVILTSIFMQRDPCALVAVRAGRRHPAHRPMERVKKLLRYMLCVEVGQPVRHVAAALGYKHHGEVMDANEEVERWRDDPYVDDMIADLGEAVNHIVAIVDAYQATGSIEDPEAALRAMGRYLRERRATQQVEEMVAA